MSTMAIPTSAKAGISRITVGRVISALAVLFLAFDTAIKFTQLGAILLTGYLGGAIASHVRVGNPVFSHVLFPFYIAAMLWGGLYLRDARVRSIISSR